MRFGDLCVGPFCKTKPPPCGTPGAPKCPPSCPTGEHQQPCNALEGIDPTTGCCFPLPPPVCPNGQPPPCASCGQPGNPCFCNGPECCPDGSAPPCTCPDGSAPPCIIGCSTCPDGSAPVPPNCLCPQQTCPDGTPPPCPATQCTPCANGTIPSPPQCACPCVAPQHPPPCGNELPGGVDGCCSGMLPKQCANGEHPPPCNPGDSIDITNGCCSPVNCYEINCTGCAPGTCAGWMGQDPNLFHYILSTFSCGAGSSRPGTCF